MVNQIISAARYNVLQSRINNILGIGSGNSGYNQDLDSATVPVGKTVTATDLNNLYNDFLNARVHQTGAVPGTISTVANEDEITEALHAAYESLIADIETDKFLVGAGQALPQSAGIDSTRTALWGGDGTPAFVQHEFTLTWGNANQRRGFFNAGGEIRFTASLTNIPIAGANAAKSQNWSDMLGNAQNVGMGTISFKHDQTTSTGSGTGETVGNFNLTNSYRQIFTKSGGVGSVYEENDYTIYAKNLNDNGIAFKVVFTDDNEAGREGATPGTDPADERVEGTLTSQIVLFRATGIYVAATDPAANTLVELE